MFAFFQFDVEEALFKKMTLKALFFVYHYIFLVAIWSCFILFSSYVFLFKRYAFILIFLIKETKCLVESRITHAVHQNQTFNFGF
jgi:hypothetical protein